MEVQDRKAGFVKKVELKDENTAFRQVENPVPTGSAGSKPVSDSVATLPVWVKIAGIILIILLVILVIMHLTGNGFGNHMAMSLTQFWLALP